MSFNKILEKYRKISFSERDKGDRFERLMQAYLQTDPLYKNRFKKIWLWNKFPGKKDLGGSDTGIDLVALTNEGDYWAIQCKCYQETTTIDKPEVDTFLSTSSRKFRGEDLKTTKFSQRLWISTTNKWGPRATETIKNQNPPVTRINLYNLQEAKVDWEKLEEGISGEQSRLGKRDLLPHQKDALEKTHEYFKSADRGKLIMACGTGKTFNSLRIAENETKGKGLILFLVPSIALLGQALREWTTYAKEPINPICICSDSEVTKKKTKNDDSDYFSVIDLALPASTNKKDIIHQFAYLHKTSKPGMTVVFSTYQSIEVISKVQKELKEIGEFDLIICDEAHRTTGVSIAGEDESAFTKVHNNNFIKGKKRIYMTATPRLYSDDAKSKAAQAEAILCSMDDPKLYGEEIYRIGFGEAVEKDLLSDYKVLILTLSDKDVPPSIQKMITSKENEINSDDASKLIGCINALSKQILGDEGLIEKSDSEPMKRAVAFCQSIKVSKKITETFNTATDAYISSLPQEKKQQMVSVESMHIDGTMSAPYRDELMSWLKSDSDNNECRVLTNVRCLSEGVDVPSLDAVLFLSARNSQVDVVQSVGRVMRKSPGKKYGYIIIPVVVPTDVEADKALNDNERYKVVWTVLNALRAHDDRFNATINKIELNKNRPSQILVGRPEYSFDENGKPIIAEEQAIYSANKELSNQLALQFEQLQGVVFARMVQKVGDRRYWEQWAKDVAIIAEKQIERIKYLISEKKDQRLAFDKFLTGLQKNINPSITETQAVDMLAQHIITKPIFEALFEGYSFVKSNAVSKAMQTMLEALEGNSVAEESETLQKFYESVRKRAEGIDNAEGKQRIIIELYDKFFKTAFPKMVEQLGIVYTPVEVVDFIIHSVNDVLQKEFGRSISDENIHILDPFVGTGTFITRMLQSGLIAKKDLARKYQNELHANEIVLLAYYIAAVNIEIAYHDQKSSDKEYEPFEGIVLTDTFQLGETDDNHKLFSEMFPQNSARVAKQKKAPLRVILGNPPYSAGQKSRNDNAQNLKYPVLEKKIENTYAKNVNTKNKNKLYDAYIKAFRWSTDRLDNEHGGIVSFVTNGGWLDNPSMAGFRNTIEKEFNTIYVINLRGNALSSGEYRRKESGNVFGGGTKTLITIIFLIKSSETKKGKADIFYYDIGDYLDRKEKLNKISNLKSISNIKFSLLKPNEFSDWINERNDIFSNYFNIENIKNLGFFNIKTIGIQVTNETVYNFSQIFLKKSKNAIIHQGYYRPFFKQYFIKSKETIYRPGKWEILSNDKNLIISLSGKSGSTDFSCLITDIYCDYQFQKNGQCFPLYYYEERKKDSPSIFDVAGENEFARRDGVSNFILERAKKQYGKNVSKEDIFFYVYGFLHSPVYRTAFANDLKKMLPRIPLVEDVRDFWSFSKAGRKLAELHINYETIPAYKDAKVIGTESKFYKVVKMRFPRKDQKDTIIFNSKITIKNIPAKAYEYVVNGKSAIEWIMERYQVTVHKESGIKNDPNDWAEEVGNPRYILDLLLSIINVSVQTVDIVESLPKIKFE